MFHHLHFFRVIVVVIFLLPKPMVAQGIQFDTASWTEILNKARTEKKLIFMDAYTTWCGPCKMMNQQTFPDPAVGNYYNAHFINVKRDMEKGEGIELAKKYEVQVFPTLLFIDGQGELVHRVSGFKDAKEFLEIGQLVMIPKNQLKNMDMRYRAGDRQAEFLYQYLKAKGNAYSPEVSKIAEDYLETQGDLGTENNMDVIFFYLGNPHSRGFKYFIQNKAQFEKRYGVRQVAEKMETTVQNVLNQQAHMSDAEIEQLFKAVFGLDGTRLASYYKITAARQRGDRVGFANAAVEHYKKYPSNDADELNEVAWTFYQVVEDKKLLKVAVSWAKKSVNISNSYHNNDTLAALYYKLKKKKPAIKHARIAIEIARQLGEDYSETQALLDKIYQL